ncbi:MAG: uracil-DNA glycosylase, partial [Actinobacteria bacterium]|nr:uracil-DNA glycosylase [Actinomycetota bacterium]
MFVGEAPGRAEDLSGEPFVGAAGKLLDELLASVDLDRRQV